MKINFELIKWFFNKCDIFQAYVSAKVYMFVYISMSSVVYFHTKKLNNQSSRSLNSSTNDGTYESTFNLHFLGNCYLIDYVTGYVYLASKTTMLRNYSVLGAFHLGYT